MRLTVPASGHTLSSPAASYTPPHLADKILASRFALEGERKLVTVMFCDIANSTPLAASVGAEAMHGLLNRFFELALAEVHRYEGTINQFLGDGFMALFGAPVAHEDHARRALLAASGIQHRLRDTPDDRLRQLRIRMGLNTGTVVVGKIGDNLRMDYTAVGDTTNLAARLQSHAEPGAIRISETTQRAALPYFEFKPLGKHQLKGIAEPMPIYDLRGPRVSDKGVPDGDGGRAGSPLVGREHELVVLEASLAALREGRGGVVVLRGEPGVGKSRLVAEVRRRPGAEGVRWLEGRALSFGRHLSYWPFIEIVKTCCAIGETDTEGQAWAKLEATVRDLFGPRAPEIVPYLATVLALEMTGEHEQRLKFLDAPALGRQVFLSMRQLFEQLAQRRPLVLVMEDWHWVDQSSIALSEHLVPLAGNHPVAFWFATRAEPGEPAARVRQVAQSHDGGVPFHEIALAPLGDAQSGALVDHLVAHLPESVRGQIVRRTEGNPFFIEEVVKALIEQGQIYREGGQWQRHDVGELAIPQSIKAAVSRRLERLTPATTEVLQTAAALGKVFEFQELAAATAVAESPLLDALDEASASQLIRAESGENFVFTHDKIREVLHEELNPIRQRRLHKRIGESLETLYAGQLEGHVEDLAYHFARSGDLKKGLDYSKRAGEQAARLHAQEEAIDFYGRARECAEELELPQELAEIEERLGDVWWAFGESGPAVEHYERSAALYQDRGRRLSVQSKIGEVYGRIGDPKGLPILEAVRSELDGEQQPADMSRVLGMIGRYHHYQGQHRRAVEYLEQARELAERQEKWEPKALVYSHLCGAYQHLTEYQESNRWARRELELAEEIDNPYVRAIGYEFMAENAAIQGFWQDAINHAAQDREWGIKAQSQERVAWSEMAGSNGLLGMGRLAEARVMAEGGLARGERIGEHRVAGLIRLCLAGIYDAMGVEGGEALAVETLKVAVRLELVHHQCESHLTLAKIAMGREDWQKAHEHGQAAKTILEGRDARANPLRFAGVRAEALARLGRLEEALAATDDATERARFAESPHYQAVAKRARAFCIVGEDPAGADRLLAEAIASFETLKSRLDEADALYQRGRLRQRAGDLPGALPHLERAAEIARACEAKTLLGRIEVALRELAPR